MNSEQTREILKKVRKIEIRTNRLVTDSLAGQYHSVFKGRGMNFDSVREYVPGDEVRTIDWNVTARMGEPFVKLFEEEREQTVLLVVDVSASTDTGLHGRRRRDVAAEACALIAFSAQRNGDRVGLVLFAGEVEQFTAPANSRTHGLRLIRDLYAHTPQTRGTHLPAALTYVRRVLRRKALVVVVSDFAAASGFDEAMRLVASKHDVVAVHVFDPQEASWPRSAGLVPLRDAETGAEVWIDTRDEAGRRALAREVAARRSATEAALVRAGADYVAVSSTEDPGDALAAFFRRRNHRR